MENVSGMDSSDIFRLGSMRVHPARYFLESGFRRWFLIFNLQHDIPASLARTRSVTRSQQGGDRCGHPAPLFQWSCQVARCTNKSALCEARKLKSYRVDSVTAY